jgi:hypothetical protein
MFKGAHLRGLAGRDPFFHNGFGTDLLTVVQFYEGRFSFSASCSTRVHRRHDSWDATVPRLRRRRPSARPVRLLRRRPISSTSYRPCRAAANPSDGHPPCSDGGARLQALLAEERLVRADPPHQETPGSPCRSETQAGRQAGKIILALLW